MDPTYNMVTAGVIRLPNGSEPLIPVEKSQVHVFNLIRTRSGGL